MEIKYFKAKHEVWHENWCYIAETKAYHFSPEITLYVFQNGDLPKSGRYMIKASTSFN